MPGARQRAFLTALVERIDLGANQIDIHFRATRLGALFDVAATSPPSAADDETQTLSVPGRLRRCGREIKMLIDETNPFAAAKPDRRLIKLLIQARRFNTALVGSDGMPFAALAKREGVSPSYFTRLVRLSYSRSRYHASHPRRAPAARSDCRQAAGALAFAAGLARSTECARLCLSRCRL